MHYFSCSPFHANEFVTDGVHFEMIAGLIRQHVGILLRIPETIWEHRRSHDDRPSRTTALIFEKRHSISRQDDCLVARICVHERIIQDFGPVSV